MEAIRTALAELVALEARFHDLLEPEKQLADATRGVVKAIASEFEKLHEAVHAGQTTADAPVVIETPVVPAPLKITVTPGTDLGTDGPGS